MKALLEPLHLDVVEYPPAGGWHEVTVEQHDRVLHTEVVPEPCPEDQTDFHVARLRRVIDAHSPLWVGWARLRRDWLRIDRTASTDADDCRRRLEVVRALDEGATLLVLAVGEEPDLPRRAA